MDPHRLPLSLYVILFLSSCFCSPPIYASGFQVSRQKSALQRHLKRLNKPAVKTIHSPDGDIIDCVDVVQQPAFNHPLLKNHTIQFSPGFHPERSYAGSKSSFRTIGKSNSIPQAWHQKGECQEGTIPIRRTKKEDVLRASSVKTFGRKKHKSVPLPLSAFPVSSMFGHQHAILYVKGSEYYGAKATINVWNPKIEQQNEFSLSQIWLLAGSFGQDLNSIEAGWQVSPNLYGDNHTRLFSYWTSDAYQETGCYNLLCSGFIQVSNKIAMGASISPISSVGGSQYDISILIWKDQSLGNWWIQFGEDHVLGYWPGFLFSYLSGSASMIEWGGEVVNSNSDGVHTTTQMGSGNFPGDGFGKASYFRNVQIVDGSNNLKSPENPDTFTEQSNCYDVRTNTNEKWGVNFYYGGPGHNSHCP